MFFGRTGSQAWRAAFGHGRWHLWFSQTYEGNMSLSIPRNMRMTTEGMLRLNSNPGMEPKHDLLQQTTNVVPYYPMRYQCFKQLISTEAGLYSALTHRPAAGDAYLRRSLKEAARASTTGSSQQLKPCPFRGGQTIQQLEGKLRMCSVNTAPNLPGEATTTTTATFYRATRITPWQTRPWGWATVSGGIEGEGG